MSIVLLVAAAATPSLLAALSRARVIAAAREMASVMARLRAGAVASGRNLAMRLVPSAGGYAYSIYADGDGDGVRSSDIASGRDPRLAGPRDLRSRYQGAGFGLLDEAIPAVPPQRGVLRPGSDPVRFGRSDIITFTPRGTSSSGSLYISDGTRFVVAVVLYGGTGRIRTWRFDRLLWRWTR
ncbi:MAG: Tfp pilus assembly protein FimT/FimU [Acidobacteriota bacterium]